MKRVAVPLGPGINCHEESVRALQLVGLQPELVLFSDIHDGRVNLLDFDAIFGPGGFSYGDHCRSGTIAGLTLQDQLLAFRETQRPMMGVCNFFQVFIAAGLFDKDGVSGGALIHNASGRFESRWVMLLAVPGSPWTDGIGGAYLRLPVAHMEGRWKKPKQPADHLSIIYQYTRNGHPTQAYADNPSGTEDAAAALACDQVLGMMPHPERAIRSEHGSTSGRLVMEAFARLVNSV
jgi:phosphoribosylformylglycinamidine (FGAM) synthase-like amidotransferase family enzyme